jgi:hypothetical protein
MAADPWLRVDAHGASGLPAAGQPGHGRTASLRRQPARIVDGRMGSGYTDVFELICGECGDHPYVDYRDIPPRLQRIRGPYPLAAGLRAYAEHLGQASGQRGPAGPEADSMGPASDRPRRSALIVGRLVRPRRRLRTGLLQLRAR